MGCDPHSERPGLYQEFPLLPVLPEGEEGMTIGTLFQNRTFWLLLCDDLRGCQ